MTAMVDALGMCLTGASSILAADSGHKRMAAATGRRIVDMVWEDLCPTDIQTREAFENAVIGSMAMGGSTNAIIHLLALSRRAGFAGDAGRVRRLCQPKRRFWRTFAPAAIRI